ncbi:MAG: gamma-glutamyl-gamma-aminobutyrate hydrolase family protein [Bacilli bacterium]
MKKIAIFTRKEILNNKEILYIPKAIYDKFSKKVLIIIIPFDDNENYINKLSLLDDINGVVLVGGDDIYKFEYDLVKYLYNNDIPTLGICLGMQTMATSIGGTLGQLNNLEHKSEKRYVHYIDINKKSLLYKIIGKEKILVNSRHKDYVINTSLTIGATCESIIEEVEDKNKKFFIGVQWHPENLDDENTQKLFNYFINKL